MKKQTNKQTKQKKGKEERYLLWKTKQTNKQNKTKER